MINTDPSIRDPFAVDLQWYHMPLWAYFMVVGSIDVEKDEEPDDEAPVTKPQIPPDPKLGAVVKETVFGNQYVGDDPTWFSNMIYD